ncbi:hypothetical protein KP509_15G019000 [Ceratopteris richardii]|uniref:Uncharacterized protein n=1 Tax=Ceratopteris richardii TaxID=49495 RepID=A0A8T2T357_CERRI|nr:hypothetical protein KP509_15G019000 [Ceratopteris richardii]
MVRDALATTITRSKWTCSVFVVLECSESPADTTSLVGAGVYRVYSFLLSFGHAIHMLAHIIGCLSTSKSSPIFNLQRKPKYRQQCSSLFNHQGYISENAFFNAPSEQSFEKLQDRDFAAHQSRPHYMTDEDQHVHYPLRRNLRDCFL